MFTRWFFLRLPSRARDGTHPFGPALRGLLAILLSGSLLSAEDGGRLRVGDVEAFTVKGRPAFVDRPGGALNVSQKPSGHG